MKLVNYENKYIKYKNKYLEIKNIIQKGGIDCKDDRVFKNILGTCWMIVIQMMLCFGDATKNDLEKELNRINKDNIDDYIKQLIELKRCELESFFPSAYLQIANREKYLFDLLKAFITRYSAKLDNLLTIKPEYTKDETNKDRCERVINSNFKKLFPYYPHVSQIGGDLIEQFYLANILGIFFLQNKIYFQNHTRENYKNIIFDPTQDIGIIVFIENHGCCCFVCGSKYKFYNDNEKNINDCEWINLLLRLEPNEDLFVIPNGIVKLDRKEYFDNIDRYKNYKRIQYLTVVSKRAFADNFDKQISMFFNGNYEINDFFLLYKIGYIYYDKQDKNKTLKYLEKSANYGFYYAQYLLGLIYESDDNLKKHYFKLAFDNGSIQAALKLGNIYYEENNYEDAVKYFKTALNINSTKKKAAEWLFNIYYSIYKNYRLAMNYKSMYLYIEATIELNNIKNDTKLKDLADEGFVDLQFEVGEIYLTKDNKQKAISYLIKATEKETNDIETSNIAALAAIKLVEIYEKIGVYENIVKYLEIAIEKGTNDIAALAALKLGEIYEKEGNHKDAVKYLEIAIQEPSTKVTAASILFPIYYKIYKNYRLSMVYRSILLGPTDKQLKALEDFTKLKELADKGFVDLQFEVGIKYIEDGKIIDGECYIELSAQAGYEKAINYFNQK